MNRFFCFLLAGFVSVSIISATGCSPGKACKVTGVITLNDEPVENVSISFVPKTEGQGDLAAGTSGKDGSYELKTLSGDILNGTTPGTYSVVLRKSEVVWDGRSWMQPPGGGEAVKATTLKELLPKQYTNSVSTPFSAVVEKGKVNKFDFNIEAR